MKMLVINGPNINMLGIREPGIYGKQTYQDLLDLIDDTAQELGIAIEKYQSNHEGAIVDKIQEAYQKVDAIVINPAALKSVAIPAVEVHISNVDARESFRQISYPGLYCEKTIKGHGLDGYKEAIIYLKEKYEKTSG